MPDTAPAGSLQVRRVVWLLGVPSLNSVWLTPLLG